MERRLDHIPQKSGSPDRKRPFDMLQHSAAKEKVKSEDSPPNIAHNSGEANESRRPDEAVKKQKASLNDEVKNLNKTIDLGRGEQDPIQNKIKTKQEKIWEKYPSIESLISEYQWEISNARNVNNFVEKLNKAIE